MAICCSSFGGSVSAFVGTKPSNATPRPTMSRTRMVMTIPRMKLRISSPRRAWNLCSLFSIYNRNRAQAAAERLSVSVQATSLTHQIGNFGKEKLLLRRRKRNRRVEGRQPDNGTIEIVERLFVNDRGN